MSLFVMDLDSSWPLGVSSQPNVDYDLYSNSVFSAWEGYDAPVSTQINGFITVHSPALDAMDYSMEMEMDGFTVNKSSVVDVEQLCPEILPGSPEMGHMTNIQFQQSIMQLEMIPVDGIQFTAANINAATSPVITRKQQATDWNDFLICDEHDVTTASKEAVATVPECESDEDVMDLLKQLSETMDGDMYIDPVELEAFVSYPLDPVSPDDVDSLLSSQLSAVEAQVTETSSCSFHEVAATPVTVPLSPVPAAIEVLTVAKSWHEPVVAKKRKKQDQNKSAALRYRQKKRSEHGSVINECEELERRNIELKTKVSEMTKEVDYLKGLIEEICAV